MATPGKVRTPGGYFLLFTENGHHVFLNAAAFSEFPQKPTSAGGMDTIGWVIHEHTGNEQGIWQEEDGTIKFWNPEWIWKSIRNRIERIIRQRPDWAVLEARAKAKEWKAGKR